MAYEYPTNAAPDRPNPWKAIVQVLLEPGETFRRFGDKVPIAPGYLAQMLLSAIALAMTLPMTLQVVEQQMRNTPNYTEQMATVARWSGIIGGIIAVVVVPWLAGLVVSLIALFFGQFQEERVPYTTYLGMVGYARMPLMLSGLLGGVLALLFGAKAATMSISLAALLPAGSSAVLRAGLGAINPFDIWYYCVLAIGFGTLHRGNARKGVGLAVALFVVSALLSMGGVAIGGKLAPGAM